MLRFLDLTIKSLGFAAPVVQLELQQNESRYPRLSVVWVLEFSFLKRRQKFQLLRLRDSTIKSFDIQVSRVCSSGSAA